MTIFRSFAAQVALLVACLVVSLVLGAGLPDQVVIHWGIDGQPNGWGSKWIGLLAMPASPLLMALLTVALPKMSPKNFELERSGGTYGWAMFLVSALMATIHAVIVLKTSGATFDIGRVMFAVLFAFWIFLGNVIGKVKRNYYMGIRTPWTLSSESVWHATHRAAGRLWVVGGVIGLIASLAGLGMVALISFLMILCCAPIVQSYFIYKRMG
jgi:uncharacterized membrane protein